MMSSAPKKSAGDARYTSQDPFIQPLNVVPYNLDRLQSVVRVRSFYVERKKYIFKL